MNLYLAEIIITIPPGFALNTQGENYLNYNNGPNDIEIRLFEHGGIEEISYYCHGRQHRPSSEGPAYHEWFLNGQPREISYWDSGDRHRPVTEGPAATLFHRDGSFNLFYYENGKQVNGLDGKPTMITISQ